VMQQAEDRVHRIGQENSVLVQYLVARGTIDEVLWRMLCNKVDVLELAKRLAKSRLEFLALLARIFEFYSLNLSLTL
jgi:SNF2 family DNA or RNA helicase